MSIKVAFLLLLGVVSGCVDSPKRVVDKYFEARRQGKDEDVIQLMAKVDRIFLHSEENQRPKSPIERKYWSLTSARVRRVDIDGKNALVMVDVYSPRLWRVTEEAQRRADGDDEAYLKAALEILNSEDLEFDDHEQQFRLVKEEWEWRILQNLQLQELRYGNNHLW